MARLICQGSSLAAKLYSEATFSYKALFYQLSQPYVAHLACCSVGSLSMQPQIFATRLYRLERGNAD